MTKKSIKIFRNRMAFFIKVILFFLCTNSFCLSQITKINYLEIQKKRDEVFVQLRSNKISIMKADKVYSQLQSGCFQQKDYTNYIELFIYKAVDFYVPNEDYSSAIIEVKNGLKNINLVKGIAKDSIYFKLISELAEYYRRSPNQTGEALKNFENCYVFLQNHPEIEPIIPNFILGFYNNFGLFFDDLGDVEKSSFYFQNALNISKKYDKPYFLYAIYTNLSKYYREKQDFNKANQMLDEALKITESNDKKIVIYLAKSKILIRQKKHKEALNELNLAESIYKNTIEKQARNLANIKLNKAECYFNLNSFDFSLNILQNLKIESDLDIFSIRKNNLFSKIYLEKKQPQKAEFYNNKVLDLIENQKINTNIYPNEIVNAYLQKAELSSVERIKYYLKTVEFATKLRQNYDLPESKLFFSEKIYPIYLKAINEIYNSGNPDKFKNEIHLIIESSKNSTLFDIINVSKFQKLELNNSLRVEIAKLKQKISKLQIKLFENGDMKIENELINLNIRLNNLNSKIRVENNRSNYTKTISIAEIQTKLAENESFINYFVDENIFIIEVINQKEVEFYFSENSYQLKNYFNHFFDEISRPSGIKKFRGQEIAKNIFTLLIKPFERKLKPNLIIARHDFLNYLPFETLVQEKRYLLEKYNISYCNSASLFPGLSLNKQGISKILTFSPFKNSNSGTYQQLSYSANEIKNIKNVQLTNQEATYDSFIKLHSNHSILHLATHTFVSDSIPEKSHIIFYPTQQNFKLYIPEIYQLDLKNTDLVVLSACNSSAGQIKKGEGVLSLTRAFQIAGCQSILSTIWLANDESTALISNGFYNYLEAGYKKDEALKLAKLDLIKYKSGIYSHPFYWANFVLIGQNQSLKLVKPSLYFYFLIPLIFLFCFIIYKKLYA
jgi:CHAT domain-containing protein